MLSLYLYDTATGRVLAVASYDERGDGASARAVIVGGINQATEYAPAGVKTARPTFAANVTIDKTAILANATDTATISNVPVGSVAKVYKDQDALPRGVATISDGNFGLRVDTAGVYQIVLSNFPTQDKTFTVVAT